MFGWRKKQVQQKTVYLGGSMKASTGAGFNQPQSTRRSLWQALLALIGRGTS